MYTAWGYEVDGEYIPPLLSIDSFNSMTGGKWTSDSLGVACALDAASQAVRNACGWHVSPSLACTARVTAEGKVARLPAICVSAISSLTEDGVSLVAGSDYEWRRDGLLRRACFRNWSPSWDGIAVSYTAGFVADACPDLAQAVCGIAEAVLSVPRGVSSESADGVSISYNVHAQSVAGAMTGQFLAQLAPYRVVSSHAA